MSYIAFPPNWWMAHDIATGLTFIAEPRRRGSRALRWSYMVTRERFPGDVIAGDVLINRARVPLYLRHAAATSFGWPL